MKKYVFIFAFAYLISALAFAGIVELLELKGGAGFNVATLLMASFCAAWRFTKDQGRLPTSDEVKSYSRLALFSVWLMSLLAAGAAVLFLFSATEINGLLEFIASKKFFFAAGVIIISLIYYVTIRWSFSWYARKVFR